MCDTKSAAKTDAKVKDLTNKKGGGNGSNSGKQTCCPDVVEFKQRNTRADYFGFDDKTNLAANDGARYWDPPTKSKSAPGSRQTRDGSVWLSVEKGQTTKCIIDFTNQLTCISNCTYEVKPASIASVLTSNITADRAMFEIRGNAKGDCTVIVKCGGKDRGWVHVACHTRKTFNVAICEVNQMVDLPSGVVGPPALTLPRVTMPVSRFQTFFDDVYRDAAVKVNLTGLPVHYLDSSVDLGPKGGFFDANGQMESPAYRARKPTGIYPVTDDIHSDVSAAHPGYDQYLFLMIPPGDRQSGKGYLNGFARGIGGDYGIFFNEGASSLSTACHEFGHLIDLRHPNDPSGTGQFPTHLRAGDNNRPANDMLNLMGYGGPRPQRKRLRYLQWKAVQGR